MRVWLGWLAASVAGFTLIGAGAHFPGSFPVGSGEDAWQPGAFIFGALFGSVSGALVGALQWLVLRGRLARAGHWVLATAVGIGVAHALADGAPTSLATPVAMTSGIALGTAQWLVLRLAGRWWIPASLATWYVGLAVGLALAETVGLMGASGPAGWALQHAFVGAVMGALYGSLTGILLPRVLPNAAAAQYRRS